jgi:hypothetical protein
LRLQQTTDWRIFSLPNTTSKEWGKLYLLISISGTVTPSQGIVGGNILLVIGNKSFFLFSTSTAAILVKNTTLATAMAAIFLLTGRRNYHCQNSASVLSKSRIGAW